jgi:hypothetical protein
MSAVPAASYLTEFTGDVRLPGSERAANVAARIEAARASGYESGKAAANAALETKLEQQRAAAARQLDAERQTWANEEAHKLAQRLAAGLAELEASIADAAARALEPMLTAELRRQSIAELRTDLELLTGVAGIAVTVCGPQDLLQALQAALSGSGRTVTYVPNREPDLRIATGQAILETRLGAWAAKIEEAVR